MQKVGPRRNAGGGETTTADEILHAPHTACFTNVHEFTLVEITNMRSKCKFIQCSDKKHPQPCALRNSRTSGRLTWYGGREPSRARLGGRWGDITYEIRVQMSVVQPGWKNINPFRPASHRESSLRSLANTATACTWLTSMGKTKVRASDPSQVVYPAASARSVQSGQNRNAGGNNQNSTLQPHPPRRGPQPKTRRSQLETKRIGRDIVQTNERGRRDANKVEQDIYKTRNK